MVNHKESETSYPNQKFAPQKTSNIKTTSSRERVNFSSCINKKAKISHTKYYYKKKP